MSLARSLAAVAAAALLAPLSALAADISVDGAWARATAGEARAGAAFMTIANTGTGDDRLMMAQAGISGSTELHTHINDNGIMRMRPVPAITIPAGGKATLQPGGDHVMFIDLKQPLVEGGSFPVTLIFAGAGPITTTVTVKGPGAMGMDHDAGHDAGHAPDATANHGAGHVPAPMQMQMQMQMPTDMPTQMQMQMPTPGQMQMQIKQ